MDSATILSRYNRDYQIANESSGYLSQACLDDMQFYLGRQWTEQDLNFLRLNGRSPITLNMIGKNIRMLSGYQVVHQHSAIVLPQHSQYQREADELSSCLQFCFQNGDGYKVLSDVFESGLISGMCLLDLYLDFTEDPWNGDLAFEKTPWSGFVIDPAFTKLDLSDAHFVIKRKYLSLMQAISLLPDYAQLLKSMPLSGAKDDKFSWLTPTLIPSQEQLVSYNEYYVCDFEETEYFIEQSGFQKIEVTEENRDLLKSLFPQGTIIKGTKKVLYKHIIVNDTYIKTDINPYGLNEYPFVLFVPFFCPEADFYDLKIQSAVRQMKESQVLTNKMLVQMRDILASQVNSGYIAKEGVMVDPESLYSSGQGKVLFVKNNTNIGEDIVRLNPAQIPPSFFQLTEFAMNAPTSILGLNEASFGETQSQDESGLLMMLRQGAAINNVQGIFSNLREVQYHLSHKILKIVQNWDVGKITQILGREPSSQFYSKSFIKYKVVVQEGNITATQRQIRFRQLLDLYNLTRNPVTGQSPISVEMLIKEAPMVGSAEIQEEIQRNQQQLAAMAQNQQNQQQMLAEAQLQNIQASTLEKQALAEERSSRSLSNIGLLEERKAKAADDRAKASLDRATALQKLQELDTDYLIRLMKMLEVIEKEGSDN